ncbi:DUF433 domain-containing protein [Desulfobacterales bacterium HSG2]|nr:DUF433 domain-containing protein [Desulfobacterales bacterium HSG2]
MKNLKLSFIVEDKVDKIIVGTLVHRILPSNIQIYTVTKGKSHFHLNYITVFEFLDKAYNHVIFLFDTDSADQVSVKQNVREYEREFRKHNLQRWVTVCPVVPQIEAWLLGNYLERPEIYREPTAMLAEAMQVEKLTGEDMEKIAQAADIDRMKKRNASFSSFVELLQNLEEKLTTERIAIDSATCDGRPYIKEAQIPVNQVIRKLAKGESFEEVITDYPALKRDDILACLDYAATVLEDIEI